MSYVRYVARRAAFAVVAFYTVVSLGFVLGNSMLSWLIGNRAARARYGGASPEAVERLREAFAAQRGLETPIYERYAQWLVNVTTLDWGYSFAYREDVIAVLDGRVSATLEYVLPGVALAVALGVVLGLFAALAKDGPFDWTVRLVSYALLGVPAFMVVVYVRYFAPGAVLEPGGLVTPKTVGAFAVALGLLAGQVRFARVAALEQTGQAFVKLLRAKGAGRLRLARHVLRNAALPIVSLSISELLAVLVLQIFVIEAVLPIRGLAEATLRSVYAADVALLIWTTMVIVVIGITANFLKDVAYGYLDPRIAAG